MGLICFVKFWLAAIRDAIWLVLLTIYVLTGNLFRWMFPLKPKSLRDEVILITGSTKGVGREICLKLASSRAKLVCLDLSKRDNTAFVTELKALGADAVGYDLDISDNSQVQRVAKQVREEVGEVTMLISNAGVTPCHEFLSHNGREITRAFSVNVFGPIWLLREFLPGMLERKHGHVVTICSVSGLVGSRNLAAFSATKHAVNGLVESLRDEMRMCPDVHFTTVYSSTYKNSLAKNVVRSRFPWLIPTMVEPSYVAEKTIEGIVKNKEYIHVLPIVNVLHILARLFPMKIYWAVSDFVGVHAEPVENTRVLGSRNSQNSYSKQ